MIFKNGERIVFAGDSVSDFDRARPVGEGLFDALGTSYIRIFDSFINAFYPELLIRVTSMGISGNNILDLKNRWETDIMALKPDWVVMLIGINDVWRQFDSPTIPEGHISPETYETEMRALVERTLPEVKGMILMTPFYMEPLKDDPMRKRMDEYGAIVKKVAKDYNLICVDLQKLFDDYLQFRHSTYITWDRVHPNQVGAMLIATELLKAAGFDKKIF